MTVWKLEYCSEYPLRTQPCGREVSAVERFILAPPGGAREARLGGVQQSVECAGGRRRPAAQQLQPNDITSSVKNTSS